MKRWIYAATDDAYIDDFLEELAYETCDLDEEFNESEFAEFKKVAADNGYKVTKRDFRIYLDKVKDIRNEDEYDEQIQSDLADYSYDDLVEFADSEIFTLRCIAAGHPSTPPEILAKLANDKNEWVREEVASNKLTPPEILAKLADDDSKSVRNAARSNKSFRR